MLGVVGLQGSAPPSSWVASACIMVAALLTAYCIGAFANHCLYVIGPDATHKLIFRAGAANFLSPSG